MLDFELNGDILTVTETLHSWTETTVRVIKYNIKTWERQTGTSPFEPCSQGDIEWVKKYYLPKVTSYRVIGVEHK